MPKYIATRWNTLCDVLEYVIQHKALIAQFIAYQTDFEKKEYEILMKKVETKIEKGIQCKAPDAPTVPPVACVPDYWSEELQPLSIIKEFTKQVEGDLHMQFHVYVAYKKVLEKFDMLGDNPIFNYFKTFFISRFDSTLNIELSHLSYVFTYDGLQEYRNKSGEDKEALMKTFTSFCIASFGTELVDSSFLIAAFEYYLDQVVYEKRSSTRFWKSMVTCTFIEHELNDDKPISFELLAKVALVFVTLPASEAIAERCFSALRRLLNDYNCSIGSDVFLAMSKIKLNSRYSRKYPL